MIKMLDYREGAIARGSILLEHYRKGKLLERRLVPNLEMGLYKALRANLRIGSGTAPTYIAIGTGETAALVGDTTLEAEVDRGLATLSRDTITITQDTAQYTKTFTLAADTDVTEAGLLNDDTAGTLCYHQVFTAIPGLETDTLKVTWRSQST